MKILGIGESIIDNIYLVEDPTISEANLGRFLPKKNVGGPVLSALVVLARLGFDCTLVTSLGRDDEARVIKRELKHERVKVIGKIQRKTKVNTILVPKQTGQRIKMRGTVNHAPIKELDRKFLHQFDVIILDRHEKAAFYEVMRKKRTTTKVVIDPSTEVSAFTTDMIEQADYPILPIEALAKFRTGDTMLARLQEIGKKTLAPIIVTAGELGSIVYNGTDMTHIPAYEVTPVDTLGAGDVYRGAFTYGIIRGWDIIKCATFGNFVAGLQCTKLGNVAAIPSKEEMLVFELFYQRKPINMPSVIEAFNQTMQI